MSRPNVLVFFTDQQRFDSLGAHGNPLGLTPELDRTATEGTHVTHAFTPQPVCAPARAMLQTGQYQNRTGVYRNARGTMELFARSGGTEFEFVFHLIP